MFVIAIGQFVWYGHSTARYNRWNLCQFSKGKMSLEEYESRHAMPIIGWVASFFILAALIIGGITILIS